MIVLALSVLLLSETLFETASMPEKLIDDEQLIAELVRADYLNGMSIRKLAAKFQIDRNKIWRYVRHLGKSAKAKKTAPLKATMEAAIVQNTLALSEKRILQNEEVIAFLKKRHEKTEPEPDFDGLRSSLSEDLRHVDEMGRKLTALSDKAFQSYETFDGESQKKPSLMKQTIAITLAAQAARERSAKLKIEVVKAKITPIETKEDRTVKIEIQRRGKKDES